MGLRRRNFITLNLHDDVAPRTAAPVLRPPTIAPDSPFHPARQYKSVDTLDGSAPFKIIDLGNAGGTRIFGADNVDGAINEFKPERPFSFFGNLPVRKSEEVPAAPFSFFEGATILPLVAAPAAVEIKQPGFLRRNAKSIAKNFTAGAVGMAVAKTAFISSARMVDATGFGTATAIGAWSMGRMVAIDYRKAREIIDGNQLSPKEAWQSLFTKEHSKKYALKFGTSFGSGLLGAYMMHHVMDGLGVVAEPLKEYTAPLTHKFSGIWDTIKTSLSGIFKTATPPLPHVDAPLAFTPTLDAPVEIAIPAAHDIIAPDLSEHAQHTMQAAAQGKAWALNEAIDGKLHGRFGFVKDFEGAAELAKRATTEEGLLKQAYIQYHGLGTEKNTQAALETIHKLGKSWVGGESLLDHTANAAPEIAPIPDAGITPEILSGFSAPVEMAPPAPAISVGDSFMRCTADNIANPFTCSAAGAEMAIDNTVDLQIPSAEGVTQTFRMKIRPDDMGKGVGQLLRDKVNMLRGMLFEPQ